MGKDKITTATAKKLLKMLEGEHVPSSSLPQTIVSELRNEDLLGVQMHGSRSTYYLIDKFASRRYIESYYLKGHTLEAWINMMSKPNESLSRAILVNETGDSKSQHIRTFRGFLVNCCEPIAIEMNGTSVTLSPTDGIAIFVQNPDSFRIPSDVVVVGIENGENFRKIRLQRHMFQPRRILFVSRYPQSADLRNWLMQIPNPYIHFGDFDLAGIHIYQSEIFKYLGERASFFIPEDIEDRISKGNNALYDRQYSKYAQMNVTDERLQPLVDLIHQYHRVYEQEGYIATSAN